MADTMKAARVHKKGEEYKLDTIAIPKIERSTDVIVKIRAASYCHTEELVRSGFFGEDKFPITASHEAVGIIDQVGDDVEGFAKGDRVGALAMQNACGNCADCDAGLEKYCENLSGMVGITVDGGFAEYMRCDSRSCLKIPESLPFAQAAPLMCAGATIYAALKLCKLNQGDVVGFVGVGGLGHIGIQLAKRMGLQVVAVDARTEPINLAKSLKYPPDLTLNSKDLDAPAALEEINKLKKNTAWPGLDAVIVATDAIPAFTYAADITRKHGLLVVAGQPSEPIPITFHSLIFRDIRVVGTLLSNVKDAQEMINLMVKHDIKVTVKEYKFDQVNTMVKDTHKPEMKGRCAVVFE